MIFAPTTRRLPRAAFSGGRNVPLYAIAFCLLGVFPLAGCPRNSPPPPSSQPATQPSPTTHAVQPSPVTPGERLAAAAIAQIGVTVEYDSRYVRLAYPGGDVPPRTGVCCDVVVRAYRTVGTDLQQLVHEDMTRAFAVYPKIYRTTAPDANIDHRRVANLMKFMERRGASLPVTDRAADYRPGDVVAWRFADGRLHIGMAVGDGQVVHNVGAGARREGRLFDWTIIGHYRYYPGRATPSATWLAWGGRP